MSLKESEQSNYYYKENNISPSITTTAVLTKTKSKEEEEEEANLAAAIAASLKDMEYNNSPMTPKYNSNELSSIDMENIQLFSTLMQRVKSVSGDVSGDTQINKLYTQIGTLQPKLVKTLDETSQKHGK
jgi:growth factor-regulated tyrosine kinase substrate